MPAPSTNDPHRTAASSEVAKGPNETRAPGPWLVAATSLLLVIIWGTTWAAIRISLEGIPPLKGVALRFGLAAVLLLVIARWMGVPLGRTRTERRLWIVQALFTYSASYCVVYWAEQWVPSGLTSVLFATFPLFVVLYSLVVLPGESLGRVGLLGVLGGFLGVAVIFSDDLGQLGTGAEAGQVRFASMVLLLSPIAAAVGQVLVKRWGQGLHALSLTAVPMALTSLGVGSAAWVLEADQPMHLSLGPVLALLYLAVVGSAVTFSLYFWLLGHVSSTKLSLVAYGTPLVAVAVGTLFMDETFTLRLGLGTLLVIGGSALVLVGKKKRNVAS